MQEFEEEEQNQKRLAILDNLNIKVLKWSIPIHIITIIFTMCAIGISIWAIIESRK
jgi:hypothetical protein